MIAPRETRYTITGQVPTYTGLCGDPQAAHSIHQEGGVRGALLHAQQPRGH